MTPGEIWDLLAKHCKANVLGKSEFESYVLEHAMSRNVREYRFQGALGFGGKVWLNTGEFPYVTCYPEDLTDEREAMIRATNDALRKLSGVRETEGAPIECLASKSLPAGQVTKCRLEGVIFYVRENLMVDERMADVFGERPTKQVLELLAPESSRRRIETVIRLEDSMKRDVVLNPAFTEAWAEAALYPEDPPLAEGPDGRRKI